MGREPTDEELIKALGYKSDDFYSDLQKISASHLLSLDDLFREGRSYEEVFSSLLKVSTARVSQIKESALSKLREKLKDMV